MLHFLPDRRTSAIPHPPTLLPPPSSPPCLLPTQIAVLKEIEGKGPYCSLVMAVVVVKDVLLFAAFAVNIELAKVVSEFVEVVGQ